MEKCLLVREDSPPPREVLTKKRKRKDAKGKNVRRESISAIVPKFNFFVRILVEKLNNTFGFLANDNFVWDTVVNKNTDFEPTVEPEIKNLNPDEVQGLTPILTNEIAGCTLFWERDNLIWINMKSLMKVVPILAKRYYITEDSKVIDLTKASLEDHIKLSKTKLKMDFLEIAEGVKSLNVPIELYMLLAFDWIDGILKTSSLLSYAHNMTIKRTKDVNYPWKCYVRKLSYEFYKSKEGNVTVVDFLRFLYNLTSEASKLIGVQSLEEYANIPFQDVDISDITFDVKFALEQRYKIAQPTNDYRESKKRKKS